MQNIVTNSFTDVIDYPGKGRTVVLLHGFLSSKEYWTKVRRLLSRHDCRVIAIDLVGFGNAAKPKNISYDYDDHVKHIDDAIRRSNIHGDYILVGHSMGALLAMRYASEHPTGISQLALVNPPMYKDEHQVNTTLRATGWFYRLLLDSRYRHILWIILRTIGPFSKHTKHSREGSLANVINVAYFFEDIEMVKIPTLLFVGKRDREIYLDNLVEEGIGKNVKVVIAETGHHAPRTNAQFVAEQILSISSF
jgi:pimeloyl-ACP methyl ester carboxylesterase